MPYLNVQITFKYTRKHTLTCHIHAHTKYCLQKQTSWTVCVFNAFFRFFQSIHQMMCNNFQTAEKTERSSDYCDWLVLACSRLTAALAICGSSPINPVVPTSPSLRRIRESDLCHYNQTKQKIWERTKLTDPGHLVQYRQDAVYDQYLHFINVGIR